MQRLSQTVKAKLDKLDRLRKGLVRAGGVNCYVTKKLVVRPWELWPLNHAGVVPSAWTPCGSAAYRLVVVAQE
jgi:hypothetical protein